MKVSKNWLKELVDIDSIDNLVELIPLRVQGGIKEATEDYIELDLKGYNRADLLSLRGVAYEIASITDSKVKFSEVKDLDYLWVEQSLPKTRIKIEDEKLCALQCVAKIEGLKFEKSPEEWVKKLADCGMRTVNNIADITNLIMLEYGQPLHSFDAADVKDDTINVRLAKKGEEIKTLDNKLRKLGSTDIVLADEEKALDVAGVMGGKDTEVKETTSTILLSASLFNPEMVRQTAYKLGLHSEASKRFYHGLTKKRLLQSLDAAIKLFQQAGGKLTALNIVGDTEDLYLKIPLSLTKVNNLIGVGLTKEQVENYLKKLNFELKEEKNTEGEPAWVVTPPYFRLDVEIEEDVIEEVARMYGYEKIPAKQLSGDFPEKTDQTRFNLISELKNKLVEAGLTEIQTYSYFSTQVLNALGFDESSKKVLIKLQNPMSKETEYLRMNIWPNLVEALAKNVKQGYKDIAVFEVGKEYMPTPEGEILEQDTLAVAIMNGTDNPLAEVNQILRAVNKDLGLNLKTGEGTPTAIISHLFHPNRFMSIFKDGKRVGGLAEVHPRVLDKFGIQKRLAILQIDINSLLK